MKEKGSTEFRLNRSLANRAKQFIYHIGVLLLEEDFLPSFLRRFAIIIETMQILYFAFSPGLINLWNSSSSMTIKKILGFSLITPLIDEFTSENFLAPYLLSIVLVLIIYSLILVQWVFYAMKRNAPDFIMHVLKLVCEIFHPILFLPLFNILIQIFFCEGGKLYLLKSEICLGGSHIIYIFVSIITVSLLLFFAFLSAYLIYDVRLKDGSDFSRCNSKGDIMFLFFKILIPIFLLIFRNSAFSIQIALYSILSYIGFEKFNKGILYYNTFTNKMMILRHSLMVWVSIVLIFCLINRNTMFDGSLFLFFYGAMVIIIIMVLRTNKRFDLLMLDINKIDSVDLAFPHLNYLIFLVKNMFQSEIFSLMINGYICYHQNNCEKIDCPCRKNFKKEKKLAKIFKGKSIIMLEEHETEVYILSVYLINSYFIFLLQKYPNAIQLRIMNALFQLDFMKVKHTALQEFLNIEIDKPSFSEDFIVYRFKYSFLHPD